MRCLALAALAVGCSTARPLKPLAAKSIALEASMPGAWISNESAAFPIGAFVLGARVGATETIETRGTLHVLPMFRGVVGTDAGVTWHATPARGWTPALHAGGDFNLFLKPTHFGDGVDDSVRAAAKVSGTAHWEPWSWIWPYVLSEHGIVLENGRYVGSILAGAQFWPSETVAISLESGWGAFNVHTDRLTQPYVGFANRGVLWFGLAVEYRGGFLRAGETP